MFEDDLWDVDSLSRPNIFRFGHCVDIGVQQAALPAPVPSGSAIFANESTAKSFLQAPSAVCPYNDGRRKVDRKGNSSGRIS